MNVNSHLDKWLFPLFGLPLFAATLSTAAANIFGALFLLLYLYSGYWRCWRTAQSRPWFWPLTAILAVNFLGMLWTQDTERGITLLLKLKFFLYIFAGATLPWNRSHFVLIVRLLLSGLLLNAVIGGLQWLQLYPWRVVDPSAGPVGYTNRITLSLALTNALLWLAYDFKNKIVLPRAWSVVLALVFFIQLITAGGRAGQLAFVLLFPVALWMLYPGRWRAWAMGVAVLSLVGTALSPHVQQRAQAVLSDIQQYRLGNTGTSVGLRLVFWEGALKMAQEHPILGVGTGDYKMEMARLQQIHVIPQTPSAPVIDNPHNSYLAYLANLGLPGLFVLLWFLWTATAEAWRNRSQSAAWFKLSYMGIFLVGSLTDTLIWSFHSVFALGLIVAIPSVLKSEPVAQQ